jgi:hypothetical protein
MKIFHGGGALVTVTLTLDLQAWVLYMTHHLVMVNICAYFEITPFITKLQPGQENSIFSISDLDLGPTGMDIVSDTPS